MSPTSSKVENETATEQTLSCLFLVPAFDGPSTKYRLLVYKDFFPHYGIRAHFEEIPRGWVAQRRLFRKAKDFDVTVLQKRLMAPMQTRYLRRCARILVYDFDDAVMFPDTVAPKKNAASRTRGRRFACVMQCADLAVAGNMFLSLRAAEHLADSVVIPTAVNIERYAKAEPLPKGEGEIRIGWIGTKGTLKYLKKIQSAMRSVLHTHRQCKFVVCADEPPEIEVDFEFHVWTEETEAREVATFDIGIMPLADTDWARGKCGFKILQYFAASKPVVCSPVGVNREIVQDGVSGFFAKHGLEWAKQINLLVRDPELRARMGAAGRKTVEEKYSCEIIGPRFCRLLHMVKKDVELERQAGFRK